MENQAPNHEQAYLAAPRARRPNRRQRRAIRRYGEQFRAQAGVEREAINPQPGRVLRPVENLPILGNQQVRGRPRIIDDRLVDSPLRVIYFKKGHQNHQPPVDGDWRDRLLCNKCRIKYKNEFCIACVRVKHMAHAKNRSSQLSRGDEFPNGFSWGLNIL